MNFFRSIIAENYGCVLVVPIGNVRHSWCTQLIFSRNFVERLPTAVHVKGLFQLFNWLKACLKNVQVLLFSQLRYVEYGRTFVWSWIMKSILMQVLEVFDLMGEGFILPSNVCLIQWTKLIGKLRWEGWHEVLWNHYSAMLLCSLIIR